MEHENHMEDMGYKMKNEVTAMPGKENKISYPSLHLNNKIPQSLKGKEIGHMCRLELVGKIVSATEYEQSESMTIEVHKLVYKGKAGHLNEKEYLSKNKEEREQYDKEEVMARK